MSTFNLGLPTDIPWKRKCFKEDMMDTTICDDDRPHPWRHSITVYEYEPEAEYQPYPDDCTVSYLKVVTSITPWAPKISAAVKDQLIGKGELTAYLDQLGQQLPVYGGLLQVSVGPPAAQQGVLPLEDYPYIMDCEPKKRQMYEMVTNTGEVLTGSRGQVTVGKSATTAHSTEHFDVDGGWNFNIGIPGVGEIGGGNKGQFGEVKSNKQENTNLLSTDKSTERREVQSHTTQLAQMYNLFQAFHVGTNRAVFLLEPRPHVVNSESVFINGVRRLEGIQEVFLVVVRPNTVTDICVNVCLETAHISFVNVAEYDTISNTAIVRPVKDFTKTVNFDIPDGWELDDSQGSNGVEVIWQYEIEKDFRTNITIPSSKKHVQVELISTSNSTGSSGGGLPGRPVLYDIPVHVHLKRETGEQARHLFLVARDLCCCDTVPAMPEDHWISYEHDLREIHGEIPVLNGIASNDTLRQSRQIAQSIREAMIAGGSSERRYNQSEITYDQSDAFYAQLAEVAQSEQLTDKLSVTVKGSEILTPDFRDKLSTIYAESSLHAVLDVDAMTLARRLNVDRAEVLGMKQEILGAVKPADPPALSLQPLRNVISVQIASTSTNPDIPHVLAVASNLNDLISVDIEDKPDVIDVVFSGIPDVGTVTDQTFVVMRDGVTLDAQVEMVEPAKARLTLFEQLQAGSLYTVVVRGETPAVTFEGRRLDGNPLSLPSGNGIEGGNFELPMLVKQRTETVNLVAPTLLKVAGARIRSTQPDPNQPRILAELSDPTQTLNVSSGETPDIVEIDFNAHPDNGSLDSSTFQVLDSGTPISGQVVQLSATKARFIATSPLQASTTYTVTLRGTTAPMITYQGNRLDGEHWSTSFG